MPTISLSTSVPANSTLGNIVNGNRFEFPPGGRITSIIGGIVAAATGVTASLSVGDRIISEDFQIPVQIAPGVVSRDRDFNWSASAKPQERIVVSLTNTTGGALVVTTLLELN